MPVDPKGDQDKNPIIVLSTFAKGGYGDLLFSLKYGESLRRKIYQETGQIIDFVILTHGKEVRDIERLKGDSEFQIPALTAEDLSRRLHQSNATIAGVIQGPVFQGTLLNVIGNLIPEGASAPVVIAGEYSANQADPLSAHHFADKVASLDFKKTILTGFRSEKKREHLGRDIITTSQELGVIVSDELRALSEEKKVNYFTQLSSTLREKIFGAYVSFDAFKRDTSLYVQYSHDIKSDEGLLPTDSFIKAQLAFSNQDKKNQQIILIGSKKEKKREVVQRQLDKIKAQGYARILLVDLDSGEEESLYDVGDGLTYRLFLTKGIDHPSFIALQALSERFTGATGDQSFVEALSSGKLIVYETLIHKIEFIESYEYEIAEALQMFEEPGENSELIKDALEANQILLHPITDEKYERLTALLQNSEVIDLLESSAKLVRDKFNLVNRTYESILEVLPEETLARQPQKKQRLFFVLREGKEEDALALLKEEEIDLNEVVLGSDSLLSIAAAKNRQVVIAFYNQTIEAKYQKEGQFDIQGFVSEKILSRLTYFLESRKRSDALDYFLNANFQNVSEKNELVTLGLTSELLRAIPNETAFFGVQQKIKQAVLSEFNEFIQKKQKIENMDEIAYFIRLANLLDDEIPTMALGAYFSFYDCYQLVLPNLPAAYRKVYVEDNFSEIEEKVKSYTDLSAVLPLLSETQIESVLKKVELSFDSTTGLRNWIKEMTKSLDKKQSSALANTIKNKLTENKFKDLLSNNEIAHFFLQHLDPKATDEIIHTRADQDKIKPLALSTEDKSALLEKKRSVVFQDTHQKLYLLPESNADLFEFLKEASPTMQVATLKALEPGLERLIRNADDLIALIHVVKEDNLKFTFPFISSRLYEILGKDKFYDIALDLGDKKFSELTAVLPLDKLVLFSKELSIYRKITTSLENEKKVVFEEKFLAEILTGKTDLLDDIFSLSHFLAVLDEEAQHHFVAKLTSEFIKDNIEIDDIDDIRSLIKHSKSTRVFEKLLNKMFDLFGSELQSLDAEDLEDLFENMIEEHFDKIALFLDKLAVTPDRKVIVDEYKGLVDWKTLSDEKVSTREAEKFKLMKAELKDFLRSADLNLDERRTVMFH